MRKLNTKALKRGFTLVELMIVVAIIGVLAALAIYGVTKYVANAKSAEGRSAVGRIAKDATSAYQKERLEATVLGLGDSTAQAANSLCAGSDPVPAAATAIQGKKYQSTPSDWGGSATGGWQCLKFSMGEPQYFQYQYQSEGGDEAGDDFKAVGVADFSGGGVNFGLTLAGEIKADATSGELVVVVAPTLDEVEGEDAADLIEE